MPISDALPFLVSWLRNPLRVAAIAPSGPALAALVTQEIGANTGPVVELGPGTGPFTRALLERGVSERDLVLVEHGLDFARILQCRFPEARILQMDAARLGDVSTLKQDSIGAVVSGLGLSMMSTAKIAAILEGAFRLLRPDGAFFQITYHRGCPVSDAVLDPLGLEAVRIGKTVRNLPPASVYRIARRPTALA